MVIKMLTGLEERVDELSENFNTDQKKKKIRVEEYNNLNERYTTGNQ